MIVLYSINNHYNYYKKIIEAGFDVPTYSYHLLYISCVTVNTEAFIYLTNLGADIHINKDCTLEMAAKYGADDIFKYCLSQGCVINNMETILLSLLSQKNANLIKYLSNTQPFFDVFEYDIAV